MDSFVLSEPVIAMPPKTSWTDVAFLFGVCVVVGAIHWMARWLIRRKPETLGQTLKEVRGQIPTEELERIALIFDRSLVNCFLCIIPFLGMWFGNTCTSLLRDRGYIVFPWIIMLGPSLLVILMVACERIRSQMLKKVVARKVMDYSDLVTSPIGKVQSLSHDDNPYAPPNFWTQ
jgi:hypothetical protein